MISNSGSQQSMPRLNPAFDWILQIRSIKCTFKFTVESSDQARTHAPEWFQNQKQSNKTNAQQKVHLIKTNENNTTALSLRGGGESHL